MCINEDGINLLAPAHIREIPMIRQTLPHELLILLHPLHSINIFDNHLQHTIIVQHAFFGHAIHELLAKGLTVGIVVFL